jgi:site-specific DNA-methyltransferase (adenine-specific)
MEDNSVDSIVTDPPYGINFMGKKWDYDVPEVEVWKEAMRVLKPGGHALIACGTKTQHRMAVNIEDAGFEIRDIVSWIYGTGFPKSHNIGKAVDKIEGNEREVVSKGVPTGSAGDVMRKGMKKDYNITKGSSPYEGWGTALKPAQEFWTLARKPLSEKTIAANVLKHGTGGINIDGCRVGTEERENPQAGFVRRGRTDEEVFGGVDKHKPEGTLPVTGRFPANLIHDGSEEAIEGMQVKGDDKSRYFYTAKASKKERNKGLEEQDKDNNHPTVKPVALMEYLCRLITPKDGTVLDPFMGSGTTGIACKHEGVGFIGIEKNEEYCEIAKARIDAAYE